jgi:hypothetical protein
MVKMVSVKVGIWRFPHNDLALGIPDAVSTYATGAKESYWKGIECRAKRRRNCG